jgi:membrane fusion protein (multidrug efflux system)
VSGPLQSPNHSIVKTTTNEYLTDVYDKDLADAKTRADKIVKDNAMGAAQDGAACTAAE